MKGHRRSGRADEVPVRQVRLRLRLRVLGSAMDDPSRGRGVVGWRDRLTVSTGLGPDGMWQGRQLTPNSAYSCRSGVPSLAARA